MSVKESRQQTSDYVPWTPSSTDSDDKQSPAKTWTFSDTTNSHLKKKKTYQIGSFWIHHIFPTRENKKNKIEEMTVVWPELLFFSHFLFSCSLHLQSSCPSFLKPLNKWMKRPWKTPETTKEKKKKEKEENHRKQQRDKESKKRD